jgi:hypothetical protein
VLKLLELMLNYWHSQKKSFKPMFLDSTFSSVQINATDFTSILYCRNAVLTYMLQPPEVLQKMLL